MNFLWFGRRLRKCSQPRRSQSERSLRFRCPLPPPAANCFPFRDRVFLRPSAVSLHLARSILAPSSRPPPVIHLLHSGLDVHVLSGVAFWPRSQPRHDAHHVASKRVSNAAISTVDVVYPFVFGHWWSCTWRPHGQDTRRRCGLGRPNCTSRSTTFA